MKTASYAELFWNEDNSDWCFNGYGEDGREDSGWIYNGIKSDLQVLSRLYTLGWELKSIVSNSTGNIRYILMRIYDEKGDN